MRQAGDADSGGGDKAAEGRATRLMMAEELARRRQATKRRGQRDRQVMPTAEGVTRQADDQK